MESNLVTQIERELKHRGAWWINVHGAGAGRRGTPDFVFILNGHGGTIEAKTPTGRLRPLQAYELERVQRAGGIAIVARTINDVREALDQLPTRARAHARTAA